MMSGITLIPYEVIANDHVRAYRHIYRRHDQITFELTKAENKRLIRLCHQFKEIEKEQPDFDQDRWVRDNIDYEGVTAKTRVVFDFMMAEWHPTKITINTESPNEGFIYILVRYEKSIQ